MEGEQHNTYDIEFYGPNSMMGGFYLGALKAGAAMAAVVGDLVSAKAYLAMYNKGRAAYDATLWNGEFYVQKYAQVMEKKYQYGEGCLSDMLLGQWLGMVAGLGRYLPPERIQSSLRAIYKNNFLPDFRNFSNVQRTYALNDEKGLLLCSWPNGGRPPLPFPYSDEVWTGIEYQVASHLIYEGLVEEGLNIVKGVRDRYDGLRRNPWNEVECGHHYARAMSSWGVLLALAGYSYSGPEMRMDFDPKINAEDFRTVWTAGSGWGIYAQKAAAGQPFVVSIEAKSGAVDLKDLSVVLPPSRAGQRVRGVEATIGGAAVRPGFRQMENTLLLSWLKPLRVEPGKPLALTVRF
jgi:Glycosyl-hydrolase family 116, catalytic region